MTAYTEAEQRYLECIAPLRGITVLGFERIYDDGQFDARRISLISKTEHSWDEIDDWVVRTLMRERIRGEFFLTFSFLTVDEPRLPFGRVMLDAPLWWAREVWALGRNLTLISVEKDYLLYLQWTEGCVGDNCYAAYRWIKPPANAPAFWG